MANMGAVREYTVPGIYMCSTTDTFTWSFKLISHQLKLIVYGT